MTIHRIAIKINRNRVYMLNVLMHYRRKYGRYMNIKVNNKIAFCDIESGQFDDNFNCVTNIDDKQGIIIAETQNESYVLYKDIDFESNCEMSFEAHVATPNTIGWIEIRIDKLTSQPIGVCQVINTGGWNKWQVVTTGIYGLTGIHDLFLTFTGPNDNQFHLGRFKFKYTADITKSIGDTDIPNPVPYLGPLEKYFIGSDSVGGGGDTNGIWDYLIGPDYSSSSFIQHEEIKLEINGVEISLNPEMHRARGTGLFYGMQKYEDLEILLIDFTNMGQPWIARMIKVENISTDKIYSLSVIAHVSSKELKTEILEETALGILADTSVDMFEGVLNWADRIAVITFNQPTKVNLQNDFYILKTDTFDILPENELNTGLYHHIDFEHKEKNKLDYIDFIRSRNIEEDSEKCIIEWNKWIKTDGLLAIQHQRIRDIVEGTLILTKMQQNRDGGFIATTRRYPLSYLRDSHAALRGLLAAGYIEEAKKFILCEDHKFKIFGRVPNAVEMGNDSYAHDFGSSGNHASETPAYYVLSVRNYFEKTDDLEFIKKIEKSLKSSVDIQLEFAEKNRWRLPFNGDETEQFTINNDGEKWGGFGNIKDWNNNHWSMSSLAACAASVDFFIQYLNRKGDIEATKMYKEKLDLIKESLDENFWRNDIGIYDWLSKADGSFSEFRVTNFTLLPLWLGARVNNPLRAVLSTTYLTQFLKPNGLLPIQPGGVEGICGHSLGYLLYNLVAANHHKMHEVYNTLVYGGTVGCWGTWSEYYGPYGLGNGTNMRVFESNINVEAILKYLKV